MGCDMRDTFTDTIKEAVTIGLGMGIALSIMGAICFGVYVGLAYMCRNFIM